jgi:hypothetical protein
MPSGFFCSQWFFLFLVDFFCLLFRKYTKGVYEIMKSRAFFTDGWNSFWHVFFGIVSIRFNIIMPIFIIYQLIHLYDKNLFIDISEFFIGIFGIYVLISVIKYNNQVKEYLQLYYYNHILHAITHEVGYDVSHDVSPTVNSVVSPTVNPVVSHDVNHVTH